MCCMFEVETQSLLPPLMDRKLHVKTGETFSVVLELTWFCFILQKDFFGAVMSQTTYYMQSLVS